MELSSNTSIKSAVNREVNSNVVVKKSLIIPLQILTHADVIRLDRELSGLDNFFKEALIRATKSNAMPQASQMLTLLFNENGLNLLQVNDRQVVGSFLKALMKKTPIVNISFATDPKPEFLMKLMQWFRKETHPYVLFKVGLQPTIAAGCVIRTTNKYYDFSFKHRFKDSKQKLVAAMGSKL